MIRRTIGNEYWLFTQTDHAHWAGEVARHIGNDRFAPATREAALTGCAQHDAGWPIHDDSPRINAKHQPMDVFEIPPSLGFEIWSESSKRAAAIDPYAGLLVSLHGIAISVFASTDVAESHGKFTDDPAYRFELNKFQHAQVELQESLRTRLALRNDLPRQGGLSLNSDDPHERELLFNFRILQATDRLNLCALSEQCPFDTMELLPHPQSDAITIDIERVGDFKLIVDPWPFTESRFSVPIRYRKIPRIDYTDDAHLRHEYASAGVETVEPLLSPKG